MNTNTNMIQKSCLSAKLKAKKAQSSFKRFDWAEVIAAHSGCDESVIGASNKIFANDPDVKRVRSAVGLIKKYFDTNTIQVSSYNGAPRALLRSKLGEFAKGINALMADADKILAEVAANYNAIMAREQEKQGDNFDWSKYPQSPQELKSLFTWEVGIGELPPACGVDLSNEINFVTEDLMVKAKAGIVTRILETLVSGPNSLVERLKALDEKLSTYEKGVSDNKRPTVKRSITNNVIEQLDALAPFIEEINSPEINSLRDKVRDFVESLDYKRLKGDDASPRQEAIEKANKIAADMSAVLGF